MALKTRSASLYRRRNNFRQVPPLFCPEITVLFADGNAKTPIFAARFKVESFDFKCSGEVAQLVRAQDS